MMELELPLSLVSVKYREPLAQVIDSYQITNAIEFLAMAYYESSYLRELSDPVDLTVGALLKKYSRKRISYEDVILYGKSVSSIGSPEGIANCIYGGTWGQLELGNTEPGDGWRFRGHGPIRLVGRKVWRQFTEHLGRGDLSECPEKALCEPVVVAHAAAWAWTHLHDFRPYGSNMRAIAKAHTGSADTTIKTRTVYRNRLLEMV